MMPAPLAAAGMVVKREGRQGRDQAKTRDEKSLFFFFFKVGAVWANVLA